MLNLSLVQPFCSSVFTQDKWKPVCIVHSINIHSNFLVITKSWKQLNVHQQLNWINKLWYICKMEYYSAIKRKVLLTHTIICLDFKYTERSHIREEYRIYYCIYIKFIKMQVNLQWQNAYQCLPSNLKKSVGGPKGRHYNKETFLGSMVEW